MFNMGDIAYNLATDTGEYWDTGSTGERTTYNALREHFPNRHIVELEKVARNQPKA
jgi:hypothetical protein